MNKKNNTKNKSAYVILISVLLISAIAIAITVSILFFGANSSNILITMEKSIKAQALTNACADEVLEKIKEDENYSEDGTITIETSECTYTMEWLSSEERNITIESVYENITKRIEIYIDEITPKINIASWQEVADFN